MEPISSAAMTIAVYLAKTLKEQKSIMAFFRDFTEASVNWIRPIFLEGESPKEILKNLQEDPDDELNLSDVHIAIRRALRNKPDAEKILFEMAATIRKKTEDSKKVINIMTITGDSNIAIQDVSGSNINIKVPSNSPSITSASPKQATILAKLDEGDWMGAFELLDQVNWGSFRGNYNQLKNEYIDMPVGGGKNDLRSRLKVFIKMRMP